jgi:nuclear transcription factor Y gamma
VSPRSSDRGPDEFQQMYAVNPRGPDPSAGDPQGYRHEEADADAEGEREDFGP